MAGNGLRPDRHAERRRAALDRPRGQAASPDRDPSARPRAPPRPRRAGLGGRKPLAHASAAVAPLRRRAQRRARGLPRHPPLDRRHVRLDLVPVGRGGRPRGRGLPPRGLRGRVGPERQVHVGRPDARTAGRGQCCRRLGPLRNQGLGCPLAPAGDRRLAGGRGPARHVGQARRGARPWRQRAVALLNLFNLH